MLFGLTPRVRLKDHWSDDLGSQEVRRAVRRAPPEESALPTPADDEDGLQLETSKPARNYFQLWGSTQCAAALLRGLGRIQYSSLFGLLL